jgi:hypothetical protein
MPLTTPPMRQRVRTMRHGSSGLSRKTSAAPPSAAMLWRAGGGVKNGFRGVAFVVDPELEVVGVGAGEFAAVVVEAHAVLGAAGFETEGVGARIKPEVAGAKFFGRQIGALRTVNQPAVAEAAHEVDAVVLAPGETAEHSLDVEGF